MIKIDKEITWKGKYQSTDNTINRKRKGKFLLKNEDISRWSCTQTQTQGNLIYFSNHRCLSWSEESKYMWTCGNDGVCTCSYTFTFFWSRKASVIAKIYQVSVCLSVSFIRRSLHFLVRIFHSFPIFFVICTSVLSFPCGLSLLLEITEYFATFTIIVSLKIVFN